jgi:hypothetical protein
MLDKDVEIKHKIILEMARILSAHTKDTHLLAILGSYDDTIPDSDILAQLKDYLAHRRRFIV